MFKITITRTGLLAIGRNGYREIGRLAIRAAAEYWWAKYLPLHFQNIAYQRYRYPRRDKRTNALKIARKPWPFGEHLEPAIGEVKPLVFSGRSRELALAAPHIHAVAKTFERYRSDTIINAPAFNFGVGKRIDMRDEVTRVNEQEIKTLERIFGAEWEAQLKTRGASATTTKKIAA